MRAERTRGPRGPLSTLQNHITCPSLCPVCHLGPPRFFEHAARAIGRRVSEAMCSLSYQLDSRQTTNAWPTSGARHRLSIMRDCHCRTRREALSLAGTARQDKTQRQTKGKVKGSGQTGQSLMLAHQVVLFKLQERKGRQ